MSKIIVGIVSELQSKGYKGDLVLPKDADYLESLKRFATNARKNAGCVAFVKSPEDISLVIHIATAGAIPICIRGGGHSTTGASSIEGGVVIDLSRYLNGVVVDAENKTARVGGGADWAKVDREAIKHGLAGVAGTVNHTGVGGLTLGGGFGWLTGLHGMVIDNLLEATLVTADGKIRTVGEKSEPDLFWAIRGGGSNFGVATEFVFRLHEQRQDVYAGFMFFLPPMLNQVAEGMENWFKTTDPKDAAMVVLGTRGPDGNPFVAACVFHNGEEEEGRRRFKFLLDLGPVMDTTKSIPYAELNALHNTAIVYGANYQLTGLTHGALQSNEALQIFDHMLHQMEDSNNSISLNEAGMNMIFEYFSGEKQASIPPGATAFRMRALLRNAPIFVTWKGDTEAESKEARARVRRHKQYCETLLAKSVEGGKKHPDETGYGNYEVHDPQATSSAAMLYGGNYARLRKLKAQYDPHLVFSQWYPIEPAV